jgi:hypothetical protein
LLPWIRPCPAPLDMRVLHVINWMCAGGFRLPVFGLNSTT